MNNNKIISTTYLKERTTIQDNVDDNKLIPSILKVQQIQLQQALGTTFYNHIMTSMPSFNAAEELLVREYIMPMVAEWAHYEALPFISYSLSNKSVTQGNSEFSTSADLASLKYLRDGVRNMAEFFTERLVVYLCDNSKLFPKFDKPDDNENLPANGSAYFSGVYMPRKKGCKNC